MHFLSDRLYHPDLKSSLESLSFVSDAGLDTRELELIVALPNMVLTITESISCIVSNTAAIGTSGPCSTRLASLLLAILTNLNASKDFVCPRHSSQLSFKDYKRYCTRKIR